MARRSWSWLLRSSPRWTLEEAFAQECRDLPRTLTLVGTHTVIVEELAWPIVEFCQVNPEIKVTILNYVGTPILDSVISGDVDMAILPLDLVRVSRQQLTVEPLWERPAALATPEGHPLALKRRITPADIAQFPLHPARDGRFPLEEWSGRGVPTRRPAGSTPDFPRN